MYVPVTVVTRPDQAQVVREQFLSTVSQHTVRDMAGVHTHVQKYHHTVQYLQMVQNMYTQKEEKWDA
jgi:hypothetical protein